MSYSANWESKLVAAGFKIDRSAVDLVIYPVQQQHRQPRQEPYESLFTDKVTQK